MVFGFWAMVLMFAMLGLAGVALAAHGQGHGQHGARFARVDHPVVQAQCAGGEHAHLAVKTLLDAGLERLDLGVVSRSFTVDSSRAKLRLPVVGQGPKASASTAVPPEALAVQAGQGHSFRFLSDAGADRS